MGPFGCNRYLQGILLKFRAISTLLASYSIPRSLKLK